MTDQSTDVSNAVPLEAGTAGPQADFRHGLRIWADGLEFRLPSARDRAWIRPARSRNRARIPAIPYMIMVQLSAVRDPDDRVRSWLAMVWL